MADKWNCYNWRIIECYLQYSMRLARAITPDPCLLGAVNMVKNKWNSSNNYWNFLSFIHTLAWSVIISFLVISSTKENSYTEPLTYTRPARKYKRRDCWIKHTQRTRCYVLSKIQLSLRAYLKRMISRPTCAMTLGNSRICYKIKVTLDSHYRIAFCTKQTAVN